MATTKVKLLDGSIVIPTGAVATTQSASDNTTKVATTAYVTTAISNLSDSAPSTLNTLNELAAALGDDANYATTTTNAIAAKLPLAGGTMTGALIVTDGSASAPSIGNSGDTNTGIYFPADDQLGLVIGGSRKLLASSAGITVNNGDLIVDTDKLVVDISAGKVGIGETSPDLDLHIKKTTTGSTGIAIENTNNGQNLDIDFYNNTGSAQGRIRYAEGAGSLGFAPNVSADNALHILYDGKVGIGTTSPDHLLEVETASSSVAPKIGFRNTQGGTQIGMPADTNALYFVTGDTERMRINSDGYVSLNRGANEYGLELKSAGTRAGLVLKKPGTDTIQGSVLMLADESFRLGTASVYNIQMYQNGNVVMPNGLVGIGNTSPGFKLTVGGGIGANQSTAYASMTGQLGFGNDYSDTQRGPNKIVLQNDGSWIAGLGISNGSTDFYSGGNFTFSTGTSLGTEKMRIDADGRVGINDGLGDSDLPHVIPAGTLVHRREGWHGGQRTHYGRTLKYSEGLSWTDAVKIDWNNSSWGAVNMRIKGQGYYNPGDAFDVVIGFQSHVAHASANYSVTSNAEGTYTHFINIVRDTTGETVIQQRNSNNSSTTEDIVYMYEWVTNNRSDQEIKVIDL